MDYLPKDPAILVSSVNMLLRDEEFDTLESLCIAFSREPKEIKDYLMKYGFVWSERQKQFRPNMHIIPMNLKYQFGYCSSSLFVLEHGLSVLYNMAFLL